MKRGGSKLPASLPRDTSADIGRKAREPAQIRQFTVEHFQSWANQLVLDNGQNWVLEPFQAAFLQDLFAGYLENWLIIPEGNAKTTLTAGLVLYHALFSPDASVVVAASSREQAEWLFQSAKGFVDRSGLGPKNQRVRGERREDEPDAFWCYEGYRRIRVNNSRIQIFAADDRTGDGIIPTLCILEELHRHRDLSLYRTWRGKLGKRGGQLVAISTAGEPDGEFEATRKLIREKAQGVREGSFLRAESPTIVLHEYAVPEDESIDDLEAVKRANPLEAITLEQLQQKHDSPTMTPSHWRRFVCGQPNRMHAWLDAKVWDALAMDVGNVADGDSVHIAVRVGAGVGVAIVAPREEGRVAVRLESIPAPAGSRVPLEGVEFLIQRLAKQYDIREVAYDPDQFRRSAEILQEAGIPMIETPQRPTRLAQATATLWRLVSAGLLGHDGDPELRSQVLAGQTKETQQGWRLEPTATTAGLIALAMAVHQATQIPADPPRFIAL